MKCLETPAKQAFQRISLFTRAWFFLILENDRPTETILHETCFMNGDSMAHVSLQVLGAIEIRRSESSWLKSKN